jgi:hypothetical protein
MAWRFWTISPHPIKPALFSGDLDLGTGGPITIPGEAFWSGLAKNKIFRLVDSTSMVHFNAALDNDVQGFTAGLSAFFGAPVYWDSPNNGPVVYLWPPKDFLKAFKFVGGQFQTTPISQSRMQNSTGFANAAPISSSTNRLLGAASCGVRRLFSEELSAHRFRA